MVYKRQLTDILDSVVSAMKFPFTFIDFTVNGDGTFTLNGINNFYHLQVGYPLPINVNDSLDDVEYYISAIDEEAKTLTLKGELPQDVIDNNLLPPAQQAYRVYFRHGTPKGVNAEMLQESVVYDKTPLVWLLEDFSEEFNDDQEAVIERESKIKLFFLTNSDHQKITNDIYGDAITPMSRLIQNFIEKLKVLPKIFDMKTDSGDEIKYTTSNHSKFGVYISNKGSEKNILEGTFSGIELGITLRIFKGDDCDFTCNPVNPCVCTPKNIIKTVEDGIVATEGVSQSQARILTACYNIVDTVTNENDSVKCDKAVFGKFKKIFNYGQNDMYLFPLEGDRFGYGSEDVKDIDVPIIIEVNNSVELICYEKGVWRY